MSMVDTPGFKEDMCYTLDIEFLFSNLLDISKDDHKSAVKRYKEISRWLDENEHVACYEPHIYSQGSFLLGTVTKSILDENEHEYEYDLDFVIVLRRPSDDLTPSKLKSIVHAAIKAYVEEKEIILQPEGRRCWTLDYFDNVRFHIDILPAIPAATYPYLNELNKLKSYVETHGEDYLCETIGQKFNVANNFSKKPVETIEKLLKDPIAITDKPPDGDYVWMLSDPKGYAAWFRRMSGETEYGVSKAVEDAPAYQSEKSVLQRVVQLLKNHRDYWMMQQPPEMQEHKPISIIITTLAARAYADLDDTDKTESTRIIQVLQAVVENMPNYIESEKSEEIVRNPVNIEENFADKWQVYPERKDLFYKWLAQVCNDLVHLDSVLTLEESTSDEVWEALMPLLGRRIVNKARNGCNDCTESQHL